MPSQGFLNALAEMSPDFNRHIVKSGGRNSNTFEFEKEVGVIPGMLYNDSKTGIQMAGITGIH